MINRLNIRNKRDKLLRLIYRLSKSSLGQLLFAPLLIAPTYFLSLYLDNDTFKKAVKQIIPDDIANALDGSILLICLIAFLVMYFGRLIINSIEQSIIDEDTTLAETGFFLLEMLDQPVSAKALRFGNIAKYQEEHAGTYTCESIFNEITKPDDQIKLICDAIYEFFNRIISDTNFRVRLVKIDDNNQPIDIEHWVPHRNQPSTRIETLQAANSAISKCLELRQAVLVSDIHKELKKPEVERCFVAQESGAEVIGSLFCYPILHNHCHSIPYVVCISTNKVCLKNEYYELYSLYMEKFALRIALEYSLLRIREGAKQ
ncbi:hypothetical protein ACFL3P_05605 [Pseudomonadota bacterium]